MNQEAPIHGNETKANETTIKESMIAQLKRIENQEMSVSQALRFYESLFGCREDDEIGKRENGEAGKRESEGIGKREDGEAGKREDGEAGKRENKEIGKRENKEIGKGEDENQSLQNKQNQTLHYTLQNKQSLNKQNQPLQNQPLQNLLNKISIAKILDVYLFSELNPRDWNLNKVLDCEEFVYGNAELFYFVCFRREGDFVCFRGEGDFNHPSLSTNHSFTNHPSTNHSSTSHPSLSQYVQNLIKITGSINVDDLIHSELQLIHSEPLNQLQNQVHSNKQNQLQNQVHSNKQNQLQNQVHSNKQNHTQNKQNQIHSNKQNHSVTTSLNWLYQIVKFKKDLGEKILLEIFNSVLYLGENSVRFKILGEIIKRKNGRDENELEIQKESVLELEIQKESVLELEGEGEMQNKNSIPTSVLANLIWPEIIFHFQDGEINQELIQLLNDLVIYAGDLIIPRLKQNPDLMKFCA